MKRKITFYLVIFLVLISESLFSQNYFWSEPVSFTDSITDNKNPVVRSLYLTDFAGYYVFWERSVDSLSTAICYRKFYAEDSVHFLLSDEGVHYTHPQPVDTKYRSSNDTSFYLFYESDEDGYNNIYYRIFINNALTGSFALTGSTANKTDLQVSPRGRITWLEENKVMYMKLDLANNIFSEPVEMDSGDCSFPSVMQSNAELWRGQIPQIAWIKKVNDSSRIMVRKYDDQIGWIDPEIVFTGVDCENLSFCTGLFEATPEILTWDYFTDSSWKIVLHDLGTNQTKIMEFKQSKPFHNKFLSGFIPVARNLEAGISSIIYQDTTMPGVYTTSYLEFIGFPITIDNYENVSQTVNPVNHQQIFMGKVEGCNYHFINFWEEKVNGHWQLKYCTAKACLSGIKENNHAHPVQLTATPNPFSEVVNISFSLAREEFVVLKIYDIHGTNIETLISGRLGKGEHAFNWKGKRYRSGIYFVQLKSSRGLSTKKIMLSK